VHRDVEGGKVDGVAVYFAYVEVLLHFGDMGGGDVVGGAPDFWRGGGVLGAVCKFVCLGLKTKGRGKRTWSVRDSQCARGMSVTTRPGASGVPRWS